MYIGLFILLVSLVGSIGTYAWFTWSSTDNTSVTLSIGELADVTFNTGPDIKVDNLSPVYNYTDGVYTTFSITNKDTTSNLLYIVKLNITSIDTELQDKTFKYVLLENDKIVSQDNFENAQNNTILTLYTGVLGKGTSSKSTTSTYKLYFYIDGNEENNPNMMNKSLIGKIDVSIEEDTPIPLADYITNLYTNADKSPVENNSITYNYASSESLMNDRLGGTTTSLDGGNIRYYGASPNNYIYFNCSDYSNQTSDTCELWRIIGVFNNQVKIMRNNIIGKYSWDTSDSTVNKGHGENEWTKADLMKLLNPGYESESVGGSLYYNSGSGNCYNGSSNSKVSCDFTSSGIKNKETRDKIAEVIWNLGGWNSSSIYSNKIYSYERGTEVYSENSTTWAGKIAIPYPSDYGYAADFNECKQNLANYDSNTNSYACRSNDWIHPIITNTSANAGWLLTHLSGYSSYVWFTLASGCTNYYNADASYAYGVTPTLFLNSTENIYGNNNDDTLGSESNPYKLNP